MNIRKLRKQDYVLTTCGKGYIEKIIKQTNEVIVNLDILRSLDTIVPTNAKMKATMIKKIIKRAYHYEVDYYYNDSDYDIRVKEFDTLKEAKDYFAKKSKDKHKYAYLRITKRSSDYDLIEVINENY